MSEMALGYDGSHQFKNLCVWVAKKLHEDEVRILSYLYEIDISSNSTSTLSKALDVFTALKKNGMLQPDNPDSLVALLEEITRRDLQRECKASMTHKQGQTLLRMNDTGHMALQQPVPPLSARRHGRTAVTRDPLKQRSIPDYFKGKKTKLRLEHKKASPTPVKSAYIPPENKNELTARSERDQLFMNIAIFTSRQSVACGRKGGACIADVATLRVLSEGHDQIPNECSCAENEKQNAGEKCPAVIDAVTDAVFKLGGPETAKGCVLFSTCFPSADSIKLLAYAGIREVVYRGEVSANLPPVLEQHGINFRRYTEKKY